MSQEEFTTLRSEDGAVQFIVQRTGLPYEQVLRIYRMGQPWPITESEAWNFESVDDMVALAPLVALDVETQQGKLDALKQTLERGDELSPEQLAWVDHTLNDSVLLRHCDTVANLTNEPIEVIYRVVEGMSAILDRMAELTDARIEEQRRNEQQLL